MFKNTEENPVILDTDDNEAPPPSQTDNLVENEREIPDNFVDDKKRMMVIMK